MLALPLLPSLLSETARADALTPPRRMMVFWFDHSNYQPLWPAKSIATTPVGNSGAKQVLLRSLGNINSVSSVFRHQLYQSLVNTDQLTMLRGFDSSGGGLAHGNGILAAAHGRNSEAAPGSLLPGHPTIDTIIENSSSVYPALGTPSNVTKALRIELIPLPCFYQRVGNALQPASYFPYYGDNNSVVTCYNQVFSGLTGGTTAPADNTNQLKSNILNRVYDSYSSFKNNRKISSDDKARLDQHMGFLSQLQASFANVMTPNACMVPPSPTGGADQAVAISLYMQLLAVAFKCGLTKYGTMFFETDTATYLPGLSAINQTEGFHGIIHGGAATDIARADRQKTAYNLYWPYLADKIATDFLTPLNVEEGSTGRTYVQNMLTGMLCMGGMIDYAGGDGGHGSSDSQQILIGNMGGAVRSGNYVAFPNSNGTYSESGLPYNTLLITFLQLMGVPASEYEPTSSDGRGVGNYVGFASDNPFRSRFYSPVSEILT